MAKRKFKWAGQVLSLLGGIVLLAGAAFSTTLPADSKQPIEQNRHATKEIKLAYIGGGGYAAGDFSQRAQSGDYLAEMGVDGFHRWPAQRFPLRVYIHDGRGVPGYKQSFSQIMSQAFQEWAQVSQGRITWMQVASPGEADIVARWSAAPRPRGGGVEAGVTETVTQIDPRTGNGSIRSAKITILTQLAGRSFSDADMRKTALHEVGHSLGLEGHSRSRSDIMFAAVNPAQVPYLKERDVNTINRLYGNTGSTGSTVATAPRQRPYAPAPANLNNYNESGYGSNSPYISPNSYGARNPISYGNPYGSNFGNAGNLNRAALRGLAWQLARELARRAAYR